MNALLRKPVFSVAGVTYCWDDVVLAAEIRGEWSQVVERARQGMALLAGEPAELIADAALEARANAFRYERNLEAAEEMEAWLGRWQLSADQWTDWLRADLLRARLPAPGEARPDADENDALEAAILSEAVCSRALETFLERLAERAAIHEARPAATVSPELAERPLGSKADRHLALARQESSFRRFVDEITTRAALEAELASCRLAWVRVSYQALRFATADEAREAVLAVSEDGASLADVAISARSIVEEGCVFLDEVESPARERLSAATPGQSVGPVAMKGEWHVYVVRERVAASLADTAVAARAKSQLVRRHVTREVSNRVQWRWPR